MDIDDSIVVPKPGRPRKARKRPSIAKCCLVLLCLCGAGVIAAVLFGVGLIVYTGVNAILNPHSHMYAEAGSNSSTVVSLVRPDTPFDVALTIWARKANHETAHPERYQDDWSPNDLGKIREMGMLVATLMPMVEHVHLPEEVSVFSEIVLRDFRLSDSKRDVDVEIDFDLPLKRFHDQSIYDTDVRAVVSFLPKSPSFFEEVSAVEDARPDVILRPPTLGEALTSSGNWGEEGSIRRKVIESIAVEIPLIQRHLYPAANQSNMNDQEADNKTVPFPKNYQHPSILTRVHVLMVNDTQPLQRVGFEENFRRFKESACRQGLNFRDAPYPSHHLCRWTYDKVGHWRARYELGQEKVDGNATHLAYMPFIGYADQGTAVLNQLKLPVHRDNETLSIEDPESINVKMTLRVSSVRRSRLALAHLITESHQFKIAHNSTDRDRQSLHDMFAVWNGLLGSPVEGVPAWRRVVLQIIELAVMCASGLLCVLYWFTRRTATGVSHKAAWYGLLSVFAIVGEIHKTWREQGALPGIIVLITGLLSYTALPFQVLLVLPLSIERTPQGWTIQRRRWTHRERGTARLDLTWIQSGLLFAVLGGLFYVTAHFGLFVIKPGLELGPERWHGFNYMMCDLAGWCGVATSLILQLVMNSRARTFAGDFALTSYLKLLGHALLLAYHSSKVMGKFYVSSGILVADALLMALSVIEVYQASTLPRVEQEAPDEDE